MNAYIKLSTKGLPLIIGGLLVFFLFPTILSAQTQFLTVDCTGATPWAFSSINAALQSTTPGTFILVTGPCNENVSLYGQNNLNLGAYYGQTATINGNITISNSNNVFLYGLSITNASGDGIDVWSSRSITLDSCTSSGSSGVGLQVGTMSDVMVNATGSFSHNARGGIVAGGNSLVNLNAWSGPIDISSNGGPGVYASLSTLGRTAVTNNVFGPGSNSGYGLDLRGGAHVQFGALYGPNLISGNQSGGAWLQETAEISFWCIGQPNLIQNNGPVGVAAGQGSQVTFAAIGSANVGAQVTGHSSAGVDLYSNSQFYSLGLNLVQRNGSASDPRSAGIRLDGNSQALLRGGDISQNNGPGLLALVNSSADFKNVTFSGNTNGVVIACDSSSMMVSDLATPGDNSRGGLLRKTPHALGNREVTKTQPEVSDWSEYKTRHDKYAKAVTKH
jgi:hypothetical protein